MSLLTRLAASLISHTGFQRHDEGHWFNSWHVPPVSARLLQLPPTIQKHVSEMNWKLSILSTMLLTSCQRWADHESLKSTQIIRNQIRVSGAASATMLMCALSSRASLFPSQGEGGARCQALVCSREETVDKPLFLMSKGKLAHCSFSASHKMFNTASEWSLIIR